jgi:pentose-5-phosphate-3-epimerase
MEIIPAPLVPTKEEFIFQLDRLSPYFSHFQIDIADGIFVKNKTVQIGEIQDVLKASAGTFDFDLLIKDWRKDIELINTLAKEIKVHMVFLHAIDSFVSDDLSQDHYGMGIAIDPHITVDTIVKKFDLSVIPAIQIMTVHPGYQGQSFLPEQLQKLEQLRKADYRGKLYLDGGINEKTIPLILSREYRPDVLCVGSYLTRAGDEIEKRIDTLRSLIS